MFRDGVENPVDQLSGVSRSSSFRGIMTMFATACEFIRPEADTERSALQLARLKPRIHREATEVGGEKKSIN
jgi:hypothetical protein